ncbi:uncharacterized protein C3orf14 homolog [Ornithorhynchus anatinus]|uniref:uncharacterized protein C3orf14 homolog n=1 Tax=Ornithorhynchus anatinus TaxID=9258 RepID=UPI00015A8FB3|nr:uncharacterized protein C3orf14 homolog [Ornithorhynchus anatinus]XP_007661811.1 uncharacterized protein C3orf14 homolog [Ornithorhynchus anatinus]XP_028907276.1 uncharacterized protein C3orf14 homolog [Ornithorhynchus anatinus]
MTSYFTEEVQLSRRYEEILSQRLMLLQQRQCEFGEEKTEKACQIQASEVAHRRNFTLLNATEEAKKALRTRLHLLPHPEILTFETLYWKSVEDCIPKWKEFLLGRVQYPVEKQN